MSAAKHTPGYDAPDDTRGIAIRAAMHNASVCADLAKALQETLLRIISSEYGEKPAIKAAADVARAALIEAGL